MLTFDMRMLEETLSTLSARQRAAFAASCAERLFAIYRLQDEPNPGETAAARAALDGIWDALRSGKIGQHIEYPDNAEEWLRGEDARWNPLNPLADNAIASTIYACQCFETGDADFAKWAAVQTYEAADYVAHTLADLAFDSGESEDAIQHSVCVQTELERQRDDLMAVKSVTSDSRDIIDELKQRSMSDALDFAKYGEQLIEFRK